MDSFLLHSQWISFSAIVSLLGLLALYGSAFAPEAIQRVFRYGKTAADGKQQRNHIQIPKKWFFHFYVFATLFYVALLYAVFRVYVQQKAVPALLALTLDALVGPHRRPNVAPESVVVAMLLIEVQVSRRLYECTQLSVYSRDGKMALIHYLCGFSFYFGVGLSLLADAKGFNGAATPALQPTAFLAANHVIGAALFLFFSSVQFKSHAILAALRKDANGRVVTYGHSIPRGHWFELVSCPHYLAEILIYLSLCVVLNGRSSTWWLVCCFVATNQLIVGLFNHHWYQKHFEDYPKRRKAVFPFVI